jgi:hypothetical protein
MHTWTTVSPHNPCPICTKPDWCTVSAEGVWAICRHVDTARTHMWRAPSHRHRLRS